MQAPRLPSYFLGEEPMRAAPTAVVERVMAGLPIAEFDHLREMLDLTVEELAERTGISLATLSRRRKEKGGGRLDPDHSDRLVRYARLYWQAVDFFERDERTAREWLRRPARALNGATPLDFARTEVGGREVEHVIGRLAYGVFQ